MHTKKIQARRKRYADPGHNLDEESEVEPREVKLLS